MTGAAHDPEAGTFLRIEGFADSVAYRAGRLTALLAAFGTPAVETDVEAVAKLWRRIRDAEAVAEQGRDVWRVSVKPSDGARVAERLDGARLLLDWGGGLVWAAVAPGTDLRAALEGMPGHATLVRADEETRARLPAFQPEAPGVAALAQGLRAKFDPRGILNPGLM